jgi:hypothetical protein
MSHSACSIALIAANTIAPPPLAQNEWSYISDQSASMRAGSRPRIRRSAKSLIIPAAAVPPSP